MKRFVIGAALLVAGLFTTSQAQIQKGNWMVGGTLLGANFGLNTGAGYNIQIQPKGAYFIEDNTALGGYVNFGILGAKGSETTYNYGVGALGRYYLSPGEKGVDNLLNHGRWFLEANVGIGGQSGTAGGDSANGLDYGFGPGYAYFITPNIGLEGLLKYTGNLGFGNRGTTSNLVFGLGFQIYLPTSKAKSIINEAK